MIDWGSHQQERGIMQRELSDPLKPACPTCGECGRLCYVPGCSFAECQCVPDQDNPDVKFCPRPDWDPEGVRLDWRLRVLNLKKEKLVTAAPAPVTPPPAAPPKQMALAL